MKISMKNIKWIRHNSVDSYWLQMRNNYKLLEIIYNYNIIRNN